MSESSAHIESVNSLNVTGGGVSSNNILAFGGRRRTKRDTIDERMSRAGAILNEIMEKSSNSISSCDLDELI